MGLSLRHRSNALSDQSGNQRQGGPGCLILFGAAFAAFGSIFVVVFLVLPLYAALSAQKWVEVPCTILESRVGISHGDGDTYRVEVRYEYHFRADDLESDPTAPRYESTRYDFYDGIYTSGSADKYAEVARLAPGTMTTCRVDPHAPDQAVLKPGIPDDLWVGFFTLIFPLVGFALMIGGVVGVVRARRRRAGRVGLSDSGSVITTLPASEEATGPVELRPAQGRLGKLVFISIFAAFWNGMVWSILVLAILPDVRHGDWGAWFPLLFLSLFAVIGLVLLGAVVHQFLALGNPRLRLTVNRGTFRPGDPLELEWECSGNPARISTLSIALEGRESATYTRGTDTTTDTHVFARMPLATLDDASAMLSGRARLVLPPTAVPTLIARHNKLQWFLTVRGNIPRWPDISDDYPIIIACRPAAQDPRSQA
jgi:hypothetical protein